MSEHGVKPAHFWIGTALTLSAVVVNIWQTNSQISSQRYENQLTQISTILNNLSGAIGELSFQLESQASVYVELQGCMANNYQAKSCWASVKSFDPVASAKAWRQLESVVNHADPFLVSQDEMNLLSTLRSVRKTHQVKIRALLPPDTPEKADAASNVAIDTRNNLQKIQDELVKTLSRRVRANGYLQV